MMAERSPRRWLLLFASLLALAAGCGMATIIASGVPVLRPVLNGLALAIGLTIALLVVRYRLATASIYGAIVTALLLLGATLVSPGLQDVHRWLTIGPLTINAASLAVPVIIALLGRLNAGSALTLTTCLATLAVLIAQPDASQTTAFAAGSAILLSRHGWRSLPLLVPLAAAAIAVWLRPDPLAPVPEVEGIVALMWAISPALALSGALALGSASLLPAIATRNSADRRTGLALSAYFATACLAPAVGAFPVPIMGHGMGFPIGFLLATALLLAPRPDQDR